MNRVRFGLVRCCCSLATLLPMAAPAVAAPAPLLNKSVIVSFSENRTLKDHTSNTVQGAVLAITIKLYISSKGRVFDEYASQTSSGAASGGQGGGTASKGPGAVHAAREWRFSGNTLVGQHLFERGARRMTIVFDSGFAGCTLSVVNAKEKGSGSIMIVSSTTGKKLEVLSSSISSPTCSVRDGNVFGGQ
jgi:hypothetical protein